MELSMRDVIAITKALADENRVRILFALQGGELCVCQVIEFLDLAPSTVSKHLAVLKHARLVEVRKEGRWLYYRLADPNAPKIVHEAIRWVREALAKEKKTIHDAKRLKAIIRMDPEVLCCQQRRVGNPLRAT